MNKKDSSRHWRTTAKILQTLLYVPLRTLLRITGTKYRASEMSIDPDRSYIIAANHVSDLDPFVLTSALPFKAFRSLLPFRYIASNRHLAIWFYRTIMLPFGSFPAREHPKYTHGIEAADTMLSSGQPVVIFPEGTHRGAGRKPAKRGVQLLAQGADRMVIPAYIAKTRWRYTITLGKPFDANNLSAEEILDRAYSLENGIV